MRTILRSVGLGGGRGDGAGSVGGWLAALLEGAADALLVLEPAGTILAANARAQAVLGCDPAGRPIGRYLPSWRDPGALAGAVGRIVELAGLRESTREFPAEASLSPIADPGGRALLLLHLRDASDRAKRIEELERLALHDALTGLPNRALLEDRLRQAMLLAERRDEPMAMLLLDLNGFKQVNDTLGHQVGDRLLQALAPRLAAPLRKSDTLARLGGDEFAVLLPPPTSLDQAIGTAERLVADLAGAPIHVDGTQLRVGASVGVALYPDHGLDPAELMRRADAAMYAAKKGRLGVAVCDPDGAGGGPGVQRRSLARDLAEAIERDGLTLLFQPKVRARGLEPVGAEALVAWEHPEHGLLRAGDILPLAEQAGLALPLTLAVLNGCLRQQQRWRGNGRMVPVAINVTPGWVRDERLAQVLRFSLAGWEGRAGELTLEVTESAIGADPARAVAVLKAVTEVGCRVSIDDFGTGYSCLAQLQRVPVAELKVDQSLVGGLASNRDVAVLVRGVVRLAHALGISVVAEGVETSQAADWLAALGCDELQGFLFGKPMPAEAFERWLARAELGGVSRRAEVAW